MSVSCWTEGETSRALAFWAEYLSCHDVSDRVGQTVGIEPFEGRVWFGVDATEVARKRDADGINAPLYLIRVGLGYYLRKGGRH